MRRRPSRPPRSRLESSSSTSPFLTGCGYSRSTEHGSAPQMSRTYSWIVRSLKSGGQIIDRPCAQAYGYRYQADRQPFRRDPPNRRNTEDDPERNAPSGKLHVPQRFPRAVTAGEGTAFADRPESTDHNRDHAR